MIDKFFLTVAEAAKYFGIGENNFRAFLNKNKDADFILMNGTKKLIKREMLEDYFRSAKSI